MSPTAGQAEKLCVLSLGLTHGTNLSQAIAGGVWLSDGRSLLIPPEEIKFEVQGQIFTFTYFDF